jgi:hypothetical protein
LGGEGEIELGVVEAIELEILEGLDGLLLDGAEAVGLRGVADEFALLLARLIQKVLHFLHVRQ